MKNRRRILRVENERGYPHPKTRGGVEKVRREKKADRGTQQLLGKYDSIENLQKSTEQK